MKRLAVLALVGVSACSLPLPHEVRSERAVEAQRRDDSDIQVLPPGPRAGATPEGIVQGFLGAEANAERRHAIAREFLTAPQARAWRDAEQVQVYDPARPFGVHRVSEAAPGEALVEVSTYVAGTVGPDGAYTAQALTPVRERYRLQQVKGQWRLSDVPAGVRLTLADRRRSYQPRIMYFVAPLAKDQPPHLVPDQVFLPDGGDLPTALVRRLLAGPTSGLRGSVTSAFPAAVTLRSVRSDPRGIVTVDLDADLRRLPAARLQALSAQLVFTLRGLGPSFAGLRLHQRGAPVTVPSAAPVQDPSAWNTFDPEGTGTNPPYYFVAGRRLRSVLTLPPGPATAGGPKDRGSLGVDAVAVSPDRTQFALLQRGTGQRVTVHIGPLRGPFTTTSSAVGLSSPSWGSGQYGLWLLQAGRQVVLLPPGSKRLRPVSVIGLPSGRLSALALSRDGARAAVVVGGRLYVARVAGTAAAPELLGLTEVLPGLTDASAVAWPSGTELAVVGSFKRPAQVLRVAVDGSATTVLNTSGLLPVSVAASTGGLLIGSGSSLYLAARGFAKVQTGTVPVYPG